MYTYRRHLFPPEIISNSVWLYHRFNLSHRDIEDLMAERGIKVGDVYLQTNRYRCAVKRFFERVYGELAVPSESQIAGSMFSMISAS